MSYLSQAQDPRRRATAITGTLAINVALGMAVVAGLTIGGFVPEKEYKPTIDFPVDEPPKPTPTPTPSAATPDSTIITPLTPIDLTSRDPIVTVQQDRLSDEVVLFPDPDPQVRPDPPRPAFTPRRAVPANAANRWITTDDYPSRPLRDGIEGTGAYRLVVGSSGRVSACDVTRSTGNAQLDAATCRFIIQRARFEPATDETGARVIGSYTGTVRWEIPD